MTEKPSSASWLFTAWLGLIPQPPEPSVVDWAATNVFIPGSARSERYEPDVSPQIKEPVEQAGRSLARSVTLIKPTQSAGSLAGEIVLDYWLSHWNGGDVCFYMQNDLAARDRWSRRLERRIKACEPVMRRTSADRFKFVNCEINFPHLNLVVQGARSDRNVASDSFRGILLEEVHDAQGGWTPGRVDQCFGRQTAYWDAVAMIISNASFSGDQLHQLWKSGTMQYWEVPCPICKQFHRMHTKRHDDGSGLNYDHNGCLMPNGDLDYQKVVARGIYYQFECGHRVNDNAEERRALSMSGRYSDPTNPGAALTDRSYTYQSVAVDYRKWIDILKRKHRSRMAQKVGDFKSWLDYLREEECQFVDEGRDRPPIERVTIISSTKRKSREGLPNRDFRFAYADWQRGRDGQPPHFWVFIQDFLMSGDALIVYEGRVDTEGELVAVLNDHGVKPVCVTVDSSWDTTNIYNLCLRRGFNAAKADDKMYWKHEDGTERFYAEPRPLCMIANAPVSQPDDPSAEPDFFLYSKYVTMERLIYLRQSKEVKYEIPADVSEDFVNQFDSWSVEVIRQRDGQSKMKWMQQRDDDHLFQCAAGILLMADLAGVFTGVGVSLPQNESQPEAIEV